MNRVAAGLDKVSNALGQWIGWLIFIMMLTTAVIVVMRYFLNLGSISLQETVLYLHGTALMLGMGYTLKTDGHVRVDVLHRRLTPRQKIWVDLVGFGVFLLPFSVFLLVTSLPYVTFSWSVLEASGAPGGLPGVFLLKTLIPVMAVLLLLQGLSESLKALCRLRQR